MTPSREASTTPGARLGQSDQCVETRIVTWLAVATVVGVQLVGVAAPRRAASRARPPYTAIQRCISCPRVHRELVE